ncbi:MAG TPA: enoyl-CoA hydratase-related protein [Pyrinomonadaceae bacterium]|nr:enoyl-CoA hydratase-related protein [Pyrinomonadaceae bacterium]
MTSLINYERRESFAVIRLNRPEKLNAVSRDMLAELTDIFKQTTDDHDLRAIILTGEGDRAFSAGTDLGELIDIPAAEARGVANRGQALCNQVENSPVPVIAAVNGIAAGAGCELALACHLRIASTNSSFSLPELKLGIIPGYGGTQRLTREIGRGRAFEIMLTGRSVAAEEALRIGLVNRVVPSDALLAEAEALAHEIAQLAPLAIRSCLEAVTRGADMQLEKALDLEAQLFARLFATDDMREGTRAFLEKRKPTFKGK